MLQPQSDVKKSSWQNLIPGELETDHGFNVDEK